jgi:hypothetical protein
MHVILVGSIMNKIIQINDRSLVQRWISCRNVRLYLIVCVEDYTWKDPI